MRKSITVVLLVVVGKESPFSVVSMTPDAKLNIRDFECFCNPTQAHDKTKNQQQQQQQQEPSNRKQSIQEATEESS